MYPIISLRSGPGLSVGKGVSYNSVSNGACFPPSLLWVLCQAKWNFVVSSAAARPASACSMAPRTSMMLNYWRFPQLSVNAWPTRMGSQRGIRRSAVIRQIRAASGVPESARRRLGGKPPPDAAGLLPNYDGAALYEPVTFPRHRTAGRIGRNGRLFYANNCTGPLVPDDGGPPFLEISSQ